MAKTQSFLPYQPSLPPSLLRCVWIPPPSTLRAGGAKHKKVAEDQRYALLEYVSHLTAKDYEATLDDLIVLGFIPKEIGEDPEKVRKG